VKRVKHRLFFISKRISDQISIVLYLNIFTPEFERDFGNAKFRVLVGLVLDGCTFVMNLK